MLYALFTFYRLDQVVLRVVLVSILIFSGPQCVAMEALMRDQFESLSSGEAKVTVTAVANYINEIKDDNLTEKQVEELVKSKEASPHFYFSFPF